MKNHPFLAHILRHAWFWPIEFWMRPLTVIDRYKEAEWAEFVASLIGGGLWSTIIGTILWLTNGDIHSIWVTGGAFAVTGAVAGAGTESKAGAGAVIGIGLVATLIAGMEVIAIAVVFLGGIIALLLVMEALMGIFAFAKAVTEVIAGSTFVIAVMFAVATFTKTTALWEIEQIIPWGIVLMFSLSISFIAGFFADHSHQLQNRHLQLKKAMQTSLLSFFYGFFWILALCLWLLSFVVSDELGQNFNLLAIFSILAPMISTGLFLYPFVVLIAIWQYRKKQVQNFSTKKLHSTAPFRWQSFAYRLPKLHSYLFQLALEYNADTALVAIQQVQLWTLQIEASRQAAQNLVKEPRTAINCCGEIAIKTNNITLLPVSVTGNIGRAIAGLAKSQDKEEEQPLLLQITDFPPKTTIWEPSHSKPIDDWLETFNTTRQSTLSKRLDYALAQLQSCQNYQHLEDYQHLLTQLLHYAKVSQLNEMLSIAEHSLVIPEHYPDWMQGGWTILQKLTEQLTEFKKYRLLESIEARRQYLTSQQQKLKALKPLAWKYLPDYWTNIGQELVGHWITQLEQAKAQAKNFLYLEIDLPQTSLLLGKQSLTLRVQNPTPVIAESLHIQVEKEKTPNIFWFHPATDYPILEGRREANLHLECQIDTPGRYVIRGQLTAQDLDGHVFKKPFSFQIIVAEKAEIYRTPDYQPYVVGEGLSNDRTFVGRTDLLAWLGSLWRQPDGKPAVVLIGQRRIGKTSLLNKIQRSNWKEMQLLPVYLDTQGIGDNRAKSFLTIMSHRMAEAVGTGKPTFTDTTPYLDFQTFLESTKTLLDKRRFLVMIDEAEPIFQGNFGPELPGFLRSLMQQAHYPTVLLFCGTYFLKRVAWDYSSVFFNTAQFKTVSYLSAPESAELLQKPSKDILEFDEYVLKQAHVLTYGQPLLLQTLGANLIEDCNATIRNGEERSNYINFKDLETATQMLVKQQENAAFKEHWINSDTKTHRVLSVLAWATDEINRPQLDIDGMLAYLKEHGLDLPRKPVFDIVQRLVDEEILKSTGPAYRFQVPLYRQWIAWRWEPSLVREEGLED